jgi:mannosyltransferase
LASNAGPAAQVVGQVNRIPQGGRADGSQAHRSPAATSTTATIAAPISTTATSTTATIAAVMSTAGLAAGLVFRHLGTKPLWLDETVTVSVARRPLTRLLPVLPHHDANAGLYYVLVHGWLRLGDSAAWIRGPSAACFVATAGLAAWVGSRWRGSWVGFAGGLLVATNQFLLFYGQEARPYALAVMLAVASTAALFWRDDGPAPTAYVILTVLLLYADLFAVLFVAAQAAALLAIHRWRRAALPVPLLRCWAIIAASVAPLALLMMISERSQISWLTKPTVRYLGQTVTAMTNGWVGLGVMAGLAAIAVSAIAVSAIAVSANAVTAVGVTDPPRDQLVVVALLAAFSIPPLLLWVVAQVVPSFIDRYVICSTVAIIGLAAVGVGALRKRAGWVFALATLVLLAALGVARIGRLEGQAFKYENPPAVVSFIERQTRTGDAIGFAGGGLRTVIDTFLQPGTAFPDDVALAPGGQASKQDDVYAREVNSASLAVRLASVERLWLVTDPTNHGYPPYGPFTPLRETVVRAFKPTMTGSFPGIDVTLYTRVDATQPRG